MLRKGYIAGHAVTSRNLQQKRRLLSKVLVLSHTNKNAFEVFNFGPTDVDTVTMTYKG